MEIIYHTKEIMVKDERQHMLEQVLQRLCNLAHERSKSEVRSTSVDSKKKTSIKLLYKV